MNHGEYQFAQAPPNHLHPKSRYVSLGRCDTKKSGGVEDYMPSLRAGAAGREDHPQLVENLKTEREQKTSRFMHTLVF